MPTHHYYVTITMTPDEETRYRTTHGLDSGDSTHEHLARTLHEEILGIGVEDGWWTDIRVT